MLSTPSLVCLVVFNILISVLGSFGNILVLLAVFKNNSLQTVPDLFIFSLASADLIVTSLQQPMFTYRIYRVNSSSTLFNTIVENIGVLSLLASITNMFVVTIDRFIAIQRPFVYVTLATKKRAVQLIFVLWVWCLTVAIVRFFINGIAKYYILWTYISSLLICTVVMYAYIFATAKKQQNKIITVRASGPTLNNQGQIDLPALRTRRKNERKPAKTIAIVVGMFIIFWAPFLIFVISNARILETQDLNLTIVFFWVFSLSLWNSSINPYIYCVRNNKYKRAFVNLLHLNNRIQIDFGQDDSYGSRPTHPRITDQRITERNAGEEGADNQ